MWTTLGAVPGKTTRIKSVIIMEQHDEGPHMFRYCVCRTSGPHPSCESSANICWAASSEVARGYSRPWKQQLYSAVAERHARYSCDVFLCDEGDANMLFSAPITEGGGILCPPSWTHDEEDRFSDARMSEVADPFGMGSHDASIIAR